MTVQALLALKVTSHKPHSPSPAFRGEKLTSPPYRKCHSKGVIIQITNECITWVKLLSYNICKDVFGILVNQFCVIKSCPTCCCDMPSNVAL